MTKREQGLSLGDLAKLHIDVKVGDGDDDFIRVHGISAKVCLALLQRHPTILVKAMQGGGVQFQDLIKAAPEVIGSVIAAGTGNFGDEEAEEDATNAPVEVQMDLLEAIAKLTFRSGFGPFVERIMKLARDAASSVSSGKVPDMRSPLESRS
jgi:hypothetical protein